MARMCCRQQNRNADEELVKLYEVVCPCLLQASECQLVKVAALHAACTVCAAGLPVHLSLRHALLLGALDDTVTATTGNERTCVLACAFGC